MRDSDGCPPGSPAPDLERPTLRRRNPRQQGLLGLADAIAWFSGAGYVVSLPLIDAQPYDLVVDGDDGLQRVQVKTTTHRARARSGGFIVSIATRGGNQSFSTVKRFDPRSCELLYVLTDDGERYLIPTSGIAAGASLTVGPRMARHRLL